MKFQIRSRWTNEVKFECELSAEMAEKPFSVQKGHVIKEALKSGSNLRYSDLSGSNLSGSNLSGSDLRDIKQDLITEILRLPAELEYLRDALIAGKVNGSTYSGTCACLAGTLAKARGLDEYNGTDIPVNGFVFIADAHSPREKWFLAIREGDTPETNPVSAISLEWVNEAIAIRDNIVKVMSAKNN